MMKIMELDTWREVGDKGNSFVITGSGSDSTDLAKRIKEFLPINTVLDGQKPAAEQNNGGPVAPSIGQPG